MLAHVCTTLFAHRCMQMACKSEIAIFNYRIKTNISKWKSLNHKVIWNHDSIRCSCCAHQTSRNLHAPFYKSSGAQNPHSIRKKASCIESKEKMSKCVFFSRPLTIKSWIHPNKQSKPKPSCIKSKVSGVYEYPHSIVKIPRGII